MSRYDTEEEQVEAIKTWWKKNGTQLLTAILVVVLAVSGWRYWTNTQYVNSVNASSINELLQANYQQGSFGEVSREALKLMQEQPESPYAVAAALMHASYSYKKNEPEQAIENLEWVLTNAQTPSIKVVAQTRLARIYSDQKNFELANAQIKELNKQKLNSVEQGSVDYAAAMIALQKGEVDNAYDMFKKVVDNKAAEENLVGLAQIQLDDLAK